MAVARVYGKADNFDIEFYQDDSGQWKCAVPFDRDGEYIVGIYAVDEAGNESYVADMLFAVDTAKLCVKVKVLHANIATKLRKYTFAADMKKYSANVIRCELCGRW